MRRSAWPVLLMLAFAIQVDPILAQQSPAAGQGESTFLSHAFAPDGKTLASLNRDQTITLWDVASGRKKETLRPSLERRERAHLIHHNADATLSLLIFGHEDALRRAGSGRSEVRARILNVTSRTTSPWIRLPERPGFRAVAFNDSYLAKGNGIWDIKTGRKIRDYTIDLGLFMGDIRFSPCGKMLAYWFCDLAGEISAIVVFDVATGRRIVQIPDRNDITFVLPPFFSADGRVMAYARPPDGVFVRHMATGREAQIAADGTLMGLLPDGRSLMTWDASGGSIRLWERVTRQQRQMLRIGAGVRSLTLSPDGSTLALIGRDKIEFLRTGSARGVVESQDR
jgi:WD40 repeat protein